MSLRLPWVSSLSPHVEPGHRRMVGAVLLVTVHAKRVMPVSTGPHNIVEKKSSHRHACHVVACHGMAPEPKLLVEHGGPPPANL